MKRALIALATFVLVLAGTVVVATPAQALTYTYGRPCTAPYTNSAPVRTYQLYLNGQWGLVRLFDGGWSAGFCADVKTTISTLTSTPHYSYVQLYLADPGTTPVAIGTITSSTATTGLAVVNDSPAIVNDPNSYHCLYVRGRIDDLAGHTVVGNTGTYCF